MSEKGTAEKEMQALRKLFTLILSMARVWLLLNWSMMSLHLKQMLSSDRWRKILLQWPRALASLDLPLIQSTCRYAINVSSYYGTDQGQHMGYGHLRLDGRHAVWP
jgi:hypothetical protein